MIKKTYSFKSWVNYISRREHIFNNDAFPLVEVTEWKSQILYGRDYITIDSILSFTFPDEFEN